MVIAGEDSLHQVDKSLPTTKTYIIYGNKALSLAAWTICHSKGHSANVYLELTGHFPGSKLWIFLVHYLKFYNSGTLAIFLLKFIDFSQITKFVLLFGLVSLKQGLYVVLEQTLQSRLAEKEIHLLLPPRAGIKGMDQHARIGMKHQI